ncbi:MAG: hypothetical protein NVSMB60_08770 [Mycobacterium sp.]
MSVVVWLSRHPWLGRHLRAFAALQILSAIAVCAAPGACASTNAFVLNWTGLRDSYGVPVGDYYLSLASVRDQLIAAGPQGSAWDPSTWAAWMLHGWDVMVTSVAAASVLTAEAGFFVGVITLALWMMRLSISTYWLTVIGAIAKAITTAVVDVTTRWGLIAAAVPVGVFLGALAVRRGEAGRGATLILTALTMPALAVTVFSDPAAMMYGPNGLLAFGRRVGFSTAQAATHNGPISGGGFDGQVDTLTTSLITHAVREPLQVFNFGHVVDHVGGCAGQWSAAVRDGAADGPITAMARCGDAAAVRYAQHLDGTNVWTGGVLAMVAVLFAWFMISAGASVFMASLRALYTTVKVLPSLLAGAISGAPQAHARTVVWQFFKHPLEVTVFIVFVSVIGLAIERLIAAPLPAELGGTNPFAHVVMLGAASVAALYLLRHIRADLSGRPAERGLLARGSDVMVGLAMSAALRAVGSAAVSGARGMAGSRGKAPWELADDMAGTKPHEILGEPQGGFDPVSAAADTLAAGLGAGADTAQGTNAGAAGAGEAAQPPGIDPVIGDRSPEPGLGGAGPEGGGEHFEPAAGQTEAAAVDPITDAASTGANEQIPGTLVPEAPSAADHELPPPDGDGPAATTVDPITG